VISIPWEDCSVVPSNMVLPNGPTIFQFQSCVSSSLNCTFSTWLTGLGYILNDGAILFISNAPVLLAPLPQLQVTFAFSKS